MRRIVVFLLILSSFCAASAQTEFGTASFYGLNFHGKPTASGHIYSQNELTAAHKTLPLGTVVKVTNLKNNRSVFVKINDRGPYVKGRVIDLSTKAAEILGYRNSGTARVKIEVVNTENTPFDLLTSSNDINKDKGSPACDPSASLAVSENTAIEDPASDPVENTKGDCNTGDKATAIKTGMAPKKEKDVPVPQPITDGNSSNTNAIINRSPYFVITNIDKSQAGFFAVQVGVFSDPSVIFALMEELEKFKQSLMIQQVKEDEKTVYKLFMGKFQNRAYADALRSVLSDKYKDALVMQYQ